MAEQAQEQPKEQTLDDVYTKFNVQEAAQEFTAKPVQQEPAKREAPVVPDPALDVDGFRKWAGNIAVQDEQVRQSLYSINERLERAEQERIRGQEEADLKAAVGKVKERSILRTTFWKWRWRIARRGTRNS